MTPLRARSVLIRRTLLLFTSSLRSEI